MKEIQAEKYCSRCNKTKPNFDFEITKGFKLSKYCIECSSKDSCKTIVPKRNSKSRAKSEPYVQTESKSVWSSTKERYKQLAIIKESNKKFQYIPDTKPLTNQPLNADIASDDLDDVFTRRHAGAWWLNQK